MKKIIVICCVLFSMLISAKGQDYHITDFLPDSLRSWKLKFALYTEGGSPSSYQVRSGYRDSINYSDDTFSKGYQISLSPTVLLNYKQITLKREVLWNTALYNQITKLKYYDDRNHTPDLTIRLDPLSYNYKTSQQGLWQRLNSSLTMTQYLFKNCGMSLSTYTDIEYRLSSVDKSEKEDNEKSISDSYLSEVKYDRTSSKSKTSSSRVNLSLTPGIVFGRTYEGYYAAKAEEILIELKKINLLKRDLNKNEFKKLSAIILQHEEKYFFDTRIKNIEALKDITEYLYKIGAIENSNIMSFLTINDIYLFSREINERPFGTKFYIKYSVGNIHSLPKGMSNNDHKIWFNTYDTLGTIISDSILEDYFSSSTMKREENTSQRGITLGFSFNRIKSWHFWYSANFYSSHIYSKYWLNYENEYEKNDRLNDTTIVSSYKSEYKSKYEKNSLIFDVDFYYQVNSRSIFKTNMGISYFNNRIKNPYYSKVIRSGSSCDNLYPRYKTIKEYISLTLQPSLMYYFTPKCSVSAGIILSLWKEYKKTSQPNSSVYIYYNSNSTDKWQFNVRYNLSLMYYF